MLIHMAMDEEISKTLMRLLAGELHHCNFRDEDYIEQRPEFELYEHLRKFIGGNPYWDINCVFDKWSELSISEQEGAIWGKESSE